MKNIYYTVRSKCFRAGSATAFMFSILCFLCTFNILNAQETTKPNNQSRTVTVTGIVRDAHTKNPIAAAQIQALNNISSSTTDEKGRFSIKLSRLDEVLSVKAYDYSVREFPLRGSMSVEIDLYPETFTNYYSNQDILTGSVRNSIALPSAKTFKDFKLSQAVSADEFVQSELGGNVRSVSRSGMAGMGTSMFIRG